MDKYRSEVNAFKEAVKNNDFYVFDTETTGLSAVENSIIEFSAIRYHGNEDGTFSENGYLDIYINPGYPLPPEIVNLTGITDEKLTKDGLTELEAAEMIRSFWGENPILAGYNSVSFDEKFLNAMYVRNFNTEFVHSNHLDVLKMAREKTAKPHKLVDMAVKAGIAKGIAFHTSIDDARATMGVFEWLLPMYVEKEPEQDIAEFQITKIARWKKSDTLDRIYVNNSQRASVYYDLVKDEWYIGVNIPEEEVVKTVFAYAGTVNIKEFISKYNS